MRPPYAIITGASRGLGLLTAKALAQVGAHLLLVARESASLEQGRNACLGLGAKSAAILALDLRDADAPAKILARCDGADGPLALINNAAIQGPIGPFWTQDSASFDDAMYVNFAAPAALMRAFCPRMIAAGEGYIVNISGGGATAPRAGFAAYAAAKTALVRLTETLAVELVGTGVRINAVAPGAFASGMTRAVAANGAAGANEQALADRLLASGDDANAQRAAMLIQYLVAGAGQVISGRLISAVWDPWEKLHERVADLSASDIYTLRRIVPEDRGQKWSAS